MVFDPLAGLQFNMTSEAAAVSHIKEEEGEEEEEEEEEESSEEEEGSGDEGDEAEDDESNGEFDDPEGYVDDISDEGQCMYMYAATEHVMLACNVHESPTIRSTRTQSWLCA